MELPHSSVHHIHQLPYLFVAHSSQITWTTLIRVFRANSDVQSTTNRKHPGCILLQGFHVGYIRNMLVCDKSLPVCHMTSTMGCGNGHFLLHSHQTWANFIYFTIGLVMDRTDDLWATGADGIQPVLLQETQCTYTRCHVTSSKITTSIGKRIWPFTCHLHLDQTRELHLFIHEKSIRALMISLKKLQHILVTIHCLWYLCSATQ